MQAAATDMLHTLTPLFPAPVHQHLHRPIFTRQLLHRHESTRSSLNLDSLIHLLPHASFLGLLLLNIEIRLTAVWPN